MFRRHEKMDCHTITMAIFALLVLAPAFLGLAFLTAVYPTPHTGLTRWGAFQMIPGSILAVLGRPIAADLVLPAVTLVQTRRIQRQNITEDST